MMIHGIALTKKQEHTGTTATKIDILEANPVYFSLFELCSAAGLSGRSAVIRAYAELEHDTLAIGTLYNWLKRYHPGSHRVNKVRYGTGRDVKVGRISTSEFVAASGELFIRTNRGWEKKFRAIKAPELCRLSRYDVVVHHLDGDHTNNDPGNLVVMSRAEHSRLHMLKYWADKRGDAR